MLVYHLQPPKKNKDKERKKKGGDKIVDGVSTEEMTPEQLQEHVQRLREEVDREREERSYFQLERDKVNSFWEITKKQLEESKATVRMKERELEDAEERHQVEIKVYKQKVKHLLYEHQNNVTELKQEGIHFVFLCKGRTIIQFARACMYICSLVWPDHVHSLVWPDHVHSLVWPDHVHSLVWPDHVHSLVWPDHVHSLVWPDHVRSFVWPGHVHSLVWPGHVHSLVWPGHVHSVVWPDHVHSLVWPDHVHSLVWPGHVHSLVWPDHVHSLVWPGHVHSLVWPDQSIGNHSVTRRYVAWGEVGFKELE